MKARFEFKYDDEYNKYLRLYFAAKAMQGIMANPDMTNDVSALIKEGKLNIHSGKDVFAFIAVQSADALIEELNKE